MTSPEKGNSLHDIPLYNPVELIGQLGLNELVDLTRMPTGERAKINGIWNLIVREERLYRESELNDVLDSPARIASPLYDESAGPAAYIDQVRSAVGQTDMTTGYAGQLDREQRQMLHTLLGKYHADNPDLWREFSPEPLVRQQLEKSLLNNIAGIVLAPRGIAIDEYNVARRALCSKHIPGLGAKTASQFRKTAGRFPIMSTHISTLKKAINTLEPRQMPAADFFKFTSDQQHDVVKAVVGEWRETGVFFQEHAPGMLTNTGRYAIAPLAHHSLIQLRQAIEAYPQLKPYEICRHFWRSPAKFYANLAEAAFAEKSKEQVQKAPPISLPPRLKKVESKTKVAEITDNQILMRQLMKREGIVPQVAELQPGDILPLTPAGEIVTTKEFDSIVDSHLEVFGRSFYEKLPDYNLLGLTLWNWNHVSVGERLRGDFHGRLSNLALARASVTEEDLRRFFGTRYDAELHSPDTAAQLVLSTDMRSGKSTSRGFLRMMMIVRREAKRPDVLYKSLHKAVSNTDRITQSVREEAMAIAEAVQSWRISLPMSGGLPGSGKHGNS